MDKALSDVPQLWATSEEDEMPEQVPIVGLFLVLGLAVSATGAAEPGSVVPVNSKQDALAVADSFVGLSAFCNDQGRDIPPSKVALSEFIDTIPYIGDTLVGRSAWRITYSGFDKVLNTLADDSAFRTDLDQCVVWVDSASGRFLGVCIRSTPSDRELPERPTIDELQMEARTHGETYVDLPGRPPRQGMLGALAKSPVWTLNAPLIVVRHALITRLGSDKFPAWILHFHGAGMQVMPAERAVLSTRLTVNASTGESLKIWTHEHDRE